MLGDRQDSEGMLINAILQDNAILLECRVTDDQFGQFRTIFSKLKMLHASGPATRSDLVKIATDRERELINSMGYGSSANWKFFEDKLIKYWSIEKLHTAFRVALEQDLESSIQTAEKAISEVSQVRSPSRSGTLADLLLPVLTKIKDGGHAKGVPFGFEQIDKATMGAKPGQLIIIGARPSQGKSALMSHLLRNVGRVTVTGLITIESSDEEVAIRVLAGEGKVDSRVLMLGKLEPDERSRLTLGGYAVSQYGQKVHIHDQSGITIAEVHSVCRRMAKDGVKVIFIDYLQIIRNPGKQTKREEVADISSQLKTIARELQICIVALAQLGRDADERRPGMGDIQHASQVEQDADQVWLIFHKKDKDGRVENSRIILEKVRDGATRDVMVNFLRPIMTFEESEEWHPNE